MGRAGQGLTALRDGWTAMRRAPKLVVGTVFAMGAVIAVPLGLVLASRATSSPPTTPVLTVAFVVAIVGAVVGAILLYCAVIIGAADALAGRPVSFGHGMRVTLRKLPVVVLWGVMTSIVHSVLTVRPGLAGTGFVQLNVSPLELLVLAFDALTLLVLPALLLDPEGRGLRHAFRVAQRAFLPSLIVAIVLRVLTFVAMLGVVLAAVLGGVSSVLSGLGIAAAAVLAALTLGVLFTWQLTARAALYRLSEEPVAAPTPPISGIAGALN